MGNTNNHIAIINRGFWPTSPVTGEALFRVAECLVGKGESVYFFHQEYKQIRDRQDVYNRGYGIKFLRVQAFTTSSSSIRYRILDAFFFGLLTIWGLLKIRPKIIYVSTDPPVLIPFIVAIYSKLLNAKYIYHLQDIHPEATNLVKPMHAYLFSLLRNIDNFSLYNASKCIVLSNDMKNTINARVTGKKEILVLNNPSVDFSDIKQKKIKHAFSFCGNLGRFQRIPLLKSAIETYLSKGGSMHFVFAGGGVYSHDICALSNQYSEVTYEGLVSSKRAAEINLECTWALLPIEDEVLRFAFPSKASSNVNSSASILAICGSNTSLARWILSNKLGLVSEPNIDDIVSEFKRIERMGKYKKRGPISSKLILQLGMDNYANKLSSEILKLKANC